MTFLTGIEEVKKKSKHYLSMSNLIIYNVLYKNPIVKVVFTVSELNARCFLTHILAFSLEGLDQK